VPDYVKILLDILHPAHIHVLRAFREDMIARGHEVHVVARDKDLTLELLERYGITADIISQQKSGRVGLLVEWLQRNVKLWRIARRVKPDVLLGLMGASIAPVGKIMRIPTVVLYNAENATQTNRVVYPLASVVVTSDSYEGPVNGNHVTHSGYHETAYLHPNRFTADPNVLRNCGIEPGTWFALVRFVSWMASHDVGEEGFTQRGKIELVRRLSEHGAVYVSSEGPLPPELEKYRLRVPSQDVHHVMAFANIMVGESATMASEAAVLGVPALYIADTSRGYINEQDQRYGMVRQAAPADLAAITAGMTELLALTKDEVSARHRRMMSDKIDTTSWLIDFVEARGWEKTWPSAVKPASNS